MGFLLSHWVDSKEAKLILILFVVDLNFKIIYLKKNKFAVLKL